MNKFFSTVPVFILISLVSCTPKSPDSNGNVAASPAGSNTSVEKNEPNTKFKPAFEGQTRIAAVKTKSAYYDTVLASKLDRPWGIAVLPDGRLLITQKSGTMVIVTMQGAVSSPITGIPAVNSGAQGGLLGVTIDPAFSNNRMVYWVFSDVVPEGNCTAVAKGRLSTDEKTIENATIIYRALPAHNSTLHYGGRILFDKGGNLFVSTGERSDLATRPLAQHLDAALGKVLHITIDGKAVASNPFINTPGAKPEIYSYGHRNVQGLAFHPVTGDLWENEFGPRGGDELNRIQAGKNYGWPIISYGEEYSGEPIKGSITQKEGLEQPVYYWDPVISPSGMTFYTGDKMPEWKNNLFIASLSGNHIDRLVIENNKVIGEERLLANYTKRFRDIAQGKDDALYAVTDEGLLYRISSR
jgi:glucose/arabinose dehydrogenase